MQARQLPHSGACQFHGRVSPVHRLVPPNVNVQVNELLRKAALQFLLAYQRDGNQVFGVYNDKHQPVEVAQQLAYMVSYYKALPEHLPEFYQYLLSYPNARPANVEDTFYWARVKFGLKPTLRIVHVVTMRGGGPTDEVAYAIAETALFEPLLRDRAGPILVHPGQ